MKVRNGEPDTPWIVERARVDGARTALVDGRLRWTFSDLSHSSAAVAAELCRRGIRQGDRVLLLAGTSAAWVACLHGTTCAGAVFVPLGPSLTVDEAARAIARVRPSIVVADDDRIVAAQRAVSAAELDSPPKVATLSSLRASADVAAFTPEPPPAVHSIVFTSGTTGDSKAAMLSHANYASSANATQERLSLDSGDVWLAPMPLHHVGGLSILMRSLRIGFSVVLLPRFDPATTIRTIESEGITIISVVPTMLHALLEEQGTDARSWTERFPTLRVVLVGGGPLGDGLSARALEAGVPIAATYGLTETSSQISTATPAETAADSAHCGRPVRGIEIRLHDVGADGFGTLCVRGPQVFGGYYGEPTGSAGLSEDGWFATGDIGRIDGDGRVLIAMRRQDRIVTGGENVSPAEVETVLGEHPDISCAGVYPVADEKWGQLVAAAVVLRSGASFEPDRLAEWCRDRMAPYKVPRRFVLRESLPVSAAGKLRRFLLAESE